eukprot:20179-Heterococcus_DN1.PRE.6
MTVFNSGTVLQCVGVIKQQATPWCQLSSAVTLTSCVSVQAGACLKAGAFIAVLLLLIGTVITFGMAVVCVFVSCGELTALTASAWRQSALIALDSYQLALTKTGHHYMLCRLAARRTLYCDERAVCNSAGVTSNLILLSEPNAQIQQCCTDDCVCPSVSAVLRSASAALH